MSKSLAQQVASLPANQVWEILDGIDPLSLEYDWRFWARPEQLAPAGVWSCWLVMAGRGFGKTRCGAEYVREVVTADPKARFALVAPTAADGRDVMVEGESGIMAISDPQFMPHYEPSKRRLTWPNGAQAIIFSAEKPSRLRGPQFTHAWCDELAAWKHCQQTLDMLKFGLRLGDHPRMIVTTTPRPTPTVKALVSDSDTVVTRGSTFDNMQNLADSFINEIKKKYEGTRLGRQEMYAEILDDHPNALWTYTMIEGLRIERAPQLAKKVIAIDPAISSNPDSDETGITVCGRCENFNGYILDDLSGIYKPAEWAKVAVEAYHNWGANYIVAEANQGGEMVRNTIHAIDPYIKVELVHASNGKYARAEPVSLLYEQGKVFHVGHFAKLEDQMATYDPSEPEWKKKSPDRLDSLVWGISQLLIGKTKKRIRLSTV